MTNKNKHTPGYIWRLFPLLADIRRADGSSFAQDLLAGTITAILLIPQALAYALLAGLPPEVGLYASVLPPIIYAFTGTSRTLAVGPVAVAAVMVAAALGAYAGSDTDKYLQGALILSALTGVIMLLMGLLRLGWLTHFISHPVLSGFTTGAAIFIVATQLSGLTGIPVPPGENFAGLLSILVTDVGELSLPTLAFGLGALLVLIAARQPLVKVLVGLGMAREKAVIAGRTAPLLVVFFTTVLSLMMDAPQRGVSVVGLVPQGLPLPSLGFLQASGWYELLPAALMIAVIAYVESISVAKVLAFRRRQKIDPNQEFRALGFSNVAAACVGTMPVAGGFSRSMVNFDAGARSQLAAVVTAILVGLAAFLFTDLLEFLPKAVLAAIIVVAVWQLIDVAALRHTWAYDRADGFAQLATIVGVLMLGIDHGLMLGAGVALLLFLYRTSRPHIAVVGRVPGSEHFRNVCRHRVETWSDLLLLRVDENIYFANSPRVETELQNQVIDSGVSDVVLILSGVAYIDTSGLEMLETLEQEFESAGVRLHLAEVKGPVMDRLSGTHLCRKLGEQRVYLSTDAAVRSLRADSDANLAL